jgi:hypothetical protein
LGYECSAAGERLDLDTKKLGRIVRHSPRVPGHRRNAFEAVSSEVTHVAYLPR